MPVYVVKKEIAGKKAGEELVMEADAAKSLMDVGYLAEKPDLSIVAETTLEGALEAMVAKHMGSAVEKLTAKMTPNGRPTGLAFSSIEPVKEPGPSLEEFFWLLGMAANTFETEKRQFASKRLSEKYKNFRRNENFDREWKEAATQQGGDVAKAATDMIETQGSIGGFAVPVEYSARLFELAGDMAILLPRVQKYPMTSLEMIIPALDYTKGSTGASPYTAGMIASWGAEGQNFAQTNAYLRDLTLRANLLCGYTRVSRTLLADNAVALQSVLTNLIAKTIAFYVDLAIFSGSGQNQPLGMVNASGPALSAARGNVNNTAGVLLSDLSSMEAKFLPEAEGRGIWLASPSFKTALYTMVSTGGFLAWLANFPSEGDGSTAIRPPVSLFGKPLFFSQLPASYNNSATGNAADIVLIDPQNYVFGSRQEIEIGVSEHESWLSNKLTWRFLFRGDGKPFLNTYLTLQNGDTVSPFVYLAST